MAMNKDKVKMVIQLCDELKKRAKVFRINKDDEYFAGNKGDYIVARGDDLKDIYIIQGEIFRETYTGASVSK